MWAEASRECGRFILRLKWDETVGLQLTWQLEERDWDAEMLQDRNAEKRRWREERWQSREKMRWGSWKRVARSWVWAQLWYVMRLHVGSQDGKPCFEYFSAWEKVYTLQRKQYFLGKIFFFAGNHCKLQKKFFLFSFSSSFAFAIAFFSLSSFTFFHPFPSFLVSFLARSLLESAVMVALKYSDKVNASMLFAIISVRKTDGHVQMRKDWEITLTLCQRFPKELSC